MHFNRDKIKGANYFDGLCQTNLQHSRRKVEDLKKVLSLATMKIPDALLLPLSWNYKLPFKITNILWHRWVMQRRRPKAKCLSPWTYVFADNYLHNTGSHRPYPSQKVEWWGILDNGVPSAIIVNPMTNLVCHLKKWQLLHFHYHRLPIMQHHQVHSCVYKNASISLYYRIICLLLPT